MKSMHKKTPDNIVIATRVSDEQFKIILETMGEDLVAYMPGCKIAYTRQEQGKVPSIEGTVTVVSAGTSDWTVAEEAAVMLELSGVKEVKRLHDVGVAGLHRLLSNLDKISAADVVIVCAGLGPSRDLLLLHASLPHFAGMDGALPSVVGGLVKAPVIAVPTSVGYGAAFQGVAALLTMLNSCAPGVTVVNIDNGFGAAVAAFKMLLLRQQKAT